MTKDKTEEQISEGLELLTEVVEKTVIDEHKKNALFDLFQSEVGLNFLTAPASSREGYHNCYIGGLFDHCFNVWVTLCDLNAAMNLGFSDESMFLVAILHDIGKATAPNLKDPHYTPVKEEWKKKNGTKYEASLPYMTTRDRTLFVLQHFGLKLSAEEFEAVMLSDGYMLEGNRSYAMKEGPLAFWLQVADSWATRQENSKKTEEMS